MIKLLLILLVGLAFESAGVVLLKKGMSQVGDMQKVSVSEVIRVVKAGLTNHQVLWGIFFEALFFGCLIVLLSKADVSFLWPLTGLSFVFATLAAMVFLGERVSALRWAGVALIMAGAALISYSQHQKEKEVKQTPTAEAAAAPESPR